MQLVVDANILVGELIRMRGRDLLGHAELDLYIPEPIWGEAMHELPLRVARIEQRGVFTPSEAALVLQHALAAAQVNVTRIPEVRYAHLEATARRRVPRDPRDWPIVALAILLQAGIWTRDHDFLGCGVATWVTDTIVAELESP